MSRTRESQRGGFLSFCIPFSLVFFPTFFFFFFGGCINQLQVRIKDRGKFDWRLQCPEIHLMHIAVFLSRFYASRIASASYAGQKPYLSPRHSISLLPPPVHSLARRPLILLMPSSGSGAQSFSLLTNKLVFVFEWLHPSSLSLRLLEKLEENSQ